MNVIDLAELRLLPDWAIRIGIRGLLGRRVQQQARLSPTQRKKEKDTFINLLKSSPLAVETAEANAQHYEVPPEFFRLVLGPRLKYSCCWFESPHDSLADAEDAMLQRTCERAGLLDGQNVLELGCGWGSLTLWMAERYPHSQITAVSNSHSQRKFIAERAQALGLSNVTLVTADMRDFATREAFDRIVSVEMFEHMRNYELLLARLAQWLAPDGQAFIHLFCHRETPYLFETTGAVNWMGRHFFTGGMMPSADLLAHFNEHLQVSNTWQVSGLHYALTCEAWLRQLDAQRGAVLRVLRSQVALQRWRMFFMACAELFRCRGGQEWFVGQYLLSPRKRLQST
jgi:cyclopropane-fatty-acyl-phospholipid synthase